MWGIRGRALSHPRPLVLSGVQPGPTTHWLWVRGCGRGDPSPTPQRALLRAGFAHCGGGLRVPGGGASCLGVGHPRSGALPASTSRPLGRAAGARFPLAVDAVCGRRGPAVLGTFSCAAVRCVLCALPGFAAPGGRCGLAPVLVPWLWPAECLSGVPRGPLLVCRALSGPVALGAPVGFSVTVVSFPTPGGCRPRLYWVAARSTWRLAENRALCACRWPLPRQGRWARSASYLFGTPRWGCPWWVPPASVLGCVLCGCLHVWTRSLTRPVSPTIRLSTGDSAGAPELFRVDADTSPCGSEDATPGCRACVLVPALLCRVGRAGLPGAFWCVSPFLWPFWTSSFVGPLRAGAALGSVVWFSVSFFPLFFPPRPGRLWLSMLPGPWCPGPLRSLICSVSPLPSFFFSLPSAPLSRAFRGFRLWPPRAFAL